MLAPNDVKEQVSFIYLHALVTTLGYSFERTNMDRDSVDASICGKGQIPDSKGVVLSPKIEVQLKATTQEVHTLSFRITKKNYDDLRQNTMVPRVLVVLFLPADDGSSIKWDLEKISLYGKAYWKSLKGMEAIANTANKTLHFEQSERLSCDVIKQWMISAANREEISYARC